MKVYSDLFTGDEVISDSYPQMAPFDNDDLKEVGFEVATRKIVKGDESFGIADNSEEGEGGGNGGDVEMVIDVIDKFSLTEMAFTKKEFMAYIRQFMKNVAEQLSAERKEKFMSGAQALVKHVLANFDDFLFYFGQNSADAFAEQKACPILGYYREGGLTPCLVYIVDALKAESF